MHARALASLIGGRRGVRMSSRAAAHLDSGVFWSLFDAQPIKLCARRAPVVGECAILIRRVVVHAPALASLIGGRRVDPARAGQTQNIVISVVFRGTFSVKLCVRACTHELDRWAPRRASVGSGRVDVLSFRSFVRGTFGVKLCARAAHMASASAPFSFIASPSTRLH